jgi:hypothetical protein
MRIAENAGPKSAKKPNANETDMRGISIHAKV